jgi:hypothetical protein
LHAFQRSALLAPVCAQAFADSLSRLRDIAHDGHRLIAQRVDAQSEAADDQDHRHCGADGAGHAQPLQAADKRREAVANQDPDHDRHEDRLRKLQQEHDRQAGHDGHRQVANDDDWLFVGNGLG